MWKANASVGLGSPSAAPGAITSPSGQKPGSWHPTVVYLLALLAAEIVVLGWLSHVLMGE